MLRHLPVLLLAIVSAAWAGPVEKLPPRNAAVIAPVHPMYLGSMNTGIKFNDAYTEGNFSIVAPVWSSLGAEATLSGGVFFVEPYISWGEQGEVASSMGIGYRHLIGNQPITALTKHDGHQASFFEEGVVLGANVFADMLDTETDHRFWQLGVGAEILTRYLEIRGNYYIPLTDKTEVDSFRTRQAFQSTSQQTSIVGSDPYATGNSILQPYSEITTQTTTTTTIERLFRRYEEGMEGWDLEVGVLIPWVDRFMDAKVIGGYYSFDNRPFGPQTGGAGNVEGWKAGLELRPVPALVVNSTWYQDERLTGSDWTLGVRAEIPFEAGDLGDGKNFWSRAADAFKPRRRHLVERMAEPVRRQNAAVKIARSTAEDKDEMETSVKKVTKVVSQTQGQLVLADDVVFVNDGPPVGNGIQAGSATGTGTAEAPVLTIQQGADLAGPRSTATGRIWSVYSQGVTNQTYVGDVFLTGSTKFIGSGKPITGISGKSFGAGPAPFLLGGIIAGLDNTGAPVSIDTLGVSGYVIAGGSTSAVGLVSTGTGIQIESVRNVLLDSNFFLAPAGHAVAVTNEGSTATTMIATGNAFVGSGGDDINVDTFDASSVSLFATNNIHTDSFGSGIDVQSDDDSSILLVVTGSTFIRNQEDSISFMSFTDSNLTAIISNNTMTDSGLGGLFGEADDDSTLTLLASNNTITRMGAAGIDLSTLFGNDSTLNATIANNNISFTFGPSIAIGNLGLNSTMNATVTGNTVFGVLNEGMLFAAISDAQTTFTVTGNSITSTAATGIFVGMGGIGDVTFSAIGNNIQLTSDEGIYMSAVGPGNTTLTVTGNTISDVGFEGIHLDAEGDSVVTIAANNNTVTRPGEEGIALHAFDQALVTVSSAAGNNINLAGVHGVELITEDTAFMNVSAFNGNVITGSLGDGINLNTVVGSLLMNGTTNNFVGPSGGSRLNTVINASGTIIINGVPTALPAILP